MQHYPKISHLHHYQILYLNPAGYLLEDLFLIFLHLYLVLFHLHLILPVSDLLPLQNHLHHSHQKTHSLLPEFLLLQILVPALLCISSLMITSVPTLFSSSSFIPPFFLIKQKEHYFLSVYSKKNNTLVISFIISHNWLPYFCLDPIVLRHRISPGLPVFSFTYISQNFHIVFTFLIILFHNSKCTNQFCLLFFSAYCTIKIAGNTLFRCH